MTEACEMVICPKSGRCDMAEEMAFDFHGEPHIKEKSCQIPGDCPACVPVNVEKLSDENLATAYRVAVQHSHDVMDKRGEMWPAAVLLGEIIVERKARERKAKKGE